MNKTINAFYLTQFEIVYNLYKKFIQIIKIMVETKAIFSGQMISMLPGILSLAGN